MFNVNTLTLFVLSIRFIAFILAHSAVIIVNRFIVFIFAPFSLGKVLNSTSYGLEIHKCNVRKSFKKWIFFLQCFVNSFHVQTHEFKFDGEGAYIPSYGPIVLRIW